MMPIYPTELWISVLFLVVMAGFIILIMVSPFIPYLIAKFSKKKILFMLDRTGQIKLKKADIRNGMYYFGDNPMRFAKQYQGSYKLGGVDVDFVHMDLGFVLKPEFQAAIKELEEQYGIKSYIDLNEAIISGKIKKEDIEVPLFFTVPLEALSEYGAEVPPASITGEVDDLMQSQKMDPMAGFGKYLPWMLMFAILIIAFALAWKIMS
jgi:hypothetical protein